MRSVLFVGPTLHGLTDRVPRTVECRPPAGAGDILRAIADGATRIGLVDGVFGQCRSVWHKEILFALSRGVPVLGAASMGALRAAECAAAGMEPVGGIALEYLNGQRVADSDVAVLHGPAELGFLPLSLALVDAEDRIGGWHRDGRLTETEAAGLLSAARSRHFTKRTWESVFATAGHDTRRQHELAAMTAVPEIGRKARDALELVALLTKEASRPPSPEAVVTEHFRTLAHGAGFPSSGLLA